ncbi:MAG: 30S ribosomal protein S18 [Candidatus Sungbacteria bacterium RIFCSPHIGHO2_01_FULL_50_25]|uniref:Small ribosomal subunit protein bS18 n=1 Tax=Candidatus Sungbacteria bacterium RIFCSPHIGHO2_01_FULL_50_25 TaxID=1802265 RepID=A0A1G2K7R6_9BACT|nr:MAG: 30S ribosomal protein S18 [Candidatus Sungbacteria bacterium RIFCSPHIGHO2_01_FULL_50_25]
MKEQIKKQCYFCTTNRPIDYKDADLLKRFMSAGAKIYSRRKSFLCAYHQREFSQAVKRARYLALVPYTSR